MFYMKKTPKRFTTIYDAWVFLFEHPAFMDKEFPELNCSIFVKYLDIDIIKINPKTNIIDDDKNKNTKKRIRLEACTQEYCDDIKDFCPSHDIDLDCGADTFEKAIIKMANKVLKKYGVKGKKPLKSFKSKYYDL